MKFQIPNSKFQILTQGFTIVETLVAITVLMIAIAGPLVVASKGLFGALASKDQMIAAYLAQESMETIKNGRDNSEALGGGLLDLPCTLTATCDASAVDTNDQILQNCPMAPSVPAGCQIYLGSNGYGHDSTDGSPTLFTRYFYLSVPPSGNSDEEIVTVVVDWNEGTTPYSISLSSELTNSVR